MGKKSGGGNNDNSEIQRMQQETIRLAQERDRMQRDFNQAQAAKEAEAKAKAEAQTAMQKAELDKQRLLQEQQSQSLSLTGQPSAGNLLAQAGYITNENLPKILATRRRVALQTNNAPKNQTNVLTSTGETQFGGS